jgi:2-oxo-4-hydroxy-4-carboxy-5-ureidoimidazoline decarboxylase
MPKISLDALNSTDEKTFVSICGPLFEHSPWIAQRTWSHHPFKNLESLNTTLCKTMFAATPDEQVNLIASHPDLVGRLAAEGRLTKESTAEQSAAGLTQLTPEEISAFDRYNAAYHSKFGFPFVICARENKKAAILAAFPIRLANSRDQETQTALAEIAKIAKLRLLDAVSEK